MKKLVLRVHTAKKFTIKECPKCGEKMEVDSKTGKSFCPDCAAPKSKKKKAGLGLSVSLVSDVQEIMKLSQGTHWDTADEQWASIYAKYYKGIYFVMNNGKPVGAGYKAQDGHFNIFDPDDRALNQEDPIVQAVKDFDNKPK